MHMQYSVKLHQAVKILSRNKILTSIKGHNPVTNLQKKKKMTYNNPSRGLANINAYANFVKIHAFVLKILRRNKIPTSIKGHNSVTNYRKLARNNPNLALASINAYMGNLIKFHQFVLKSGHIISRLMTKSTKWHVRPAKTQISLGIRPV